MFRVGFGQDSHRFVSDKDNKKLILGGVEIANCAGLEGNSDADVIAHAIFNSLSQAIGDRSIGVYADKLCLEENILDSFRYLEIMRDKLKEKNLEINNLGISVEAKIPRLEPYHDKIKKRFCDFFHLDQDRIGLVFTSGEGLTAFGQGKGIQVSVVVSLFAIQS